MFWAVVGAAALSAGLVMAQAIVSRRHADIPKPASWHLAVLAGMAVLVLFYPTDDARATAAAQEQARAVLEQTHIVTTTTTTLVEKPVEIGEGAGFGIGAAHIADALDPSEILRGMESGPQGFSVEGLSQGVPLGTIQIPAIDVDWVFFLGVKERILKDGPGLWPWFAGPGEDGLALIAGHRTTWGAPFNRIDELQPGDEILLDVEGETYRYLVTESQVVKEADWRETVEERHESLKKPGLTLSACHPKGSARQRILVHAELDADR